VGYVRCLTGTGCGKEITEGMKFCYYCSHPLPTRDRESTTIETKSPMISEPAMFPEPPQSIPDMRPVMQKNVETPQLQDAGSTEGLTGSYPSWVKNAIIGTVRNPEHRSTNQYSFRLELTDIVGNITEVIPVEFNPSRVKGLILKDGDLIAMTGGRDKGGLFQPDMIYNSTTEAEINLRSFGFFNILILIFL